LSPPNYERLAIIGRCFRDLRASFGRGAKSIPDNRMLRLAPASGIAPLGLGRIRESLTSLGIGQGDLLLVHSSANTLFQAGQEHDDATPQDMISYSDAVVDLLLGQIGPTGTLLMPTESLGDVFVASRKKEVFDYRRATSTRGLITELFRRRRNAIRSVHPWYNLAAIGPLAEELMKDHHLSTPYTMDIHSPWSKFTQRAGKVLMLGPDLDHNSLIHLPEYRFPEEYPRAIYYNKTIPLRYVSRAGAVNEMKVAIHVVSWKHGECTQFCKYLQEKYSLYNVVAAGCTEFVCYNAEKQFQALVQEMQSDVCWYDVRYWPAAA
jgi:aminoglycoside N3'-acetyltransferase